MHKLSKVVSAAILLVGCRVLAQQLGVPGAAPADSPEQQDKYLWLEDVHSARSMQWVKDENEKTARVFEADPRFKKYQEEALRVDEDPNRLPVPQLRGNDVYDFWRDTDHPYGVLRRSALKDFLKPNPIWTTVLDYDALGKQENVKWVSHGMDCLYPDDQLCMMNLTVGGEDASTSREFDLKTGKFVENGFVLPRSRQFVTWLDKDTLLVSRDWGSGTMTQSGFPFVVKEWKRGTPLEKAKEIYRGKETDSRVLVSSFHDKQGQTLTVIRRGVTFFESEVYLLTPQGPKRLFVPAKSSLLGLVDGHVLLVVREDWSAGGKSFAKGSLVDLNLGDLMKDAEHLKPQVVFAPSSDEYLQGVYTTAGSVLITTLKNVCGRVYVYTPTLKGWSKKPLALPENLSVGISTVSEIDDTFFLNLTGFATPPSLYLGEASKGTLKLVKSESPRFDSSNEVVEQMYATSKDGTRIPYFVVHPKGMKLDGSHPTLLYAYGGFEAPITPYYDPILGKLWLEHGGLYVVANIRGGGEYGPAWHEAGLKTHRQRIYEDFAAVGEDLIVRKITSSPHLGIMGGSASGLLMGVEMEQHPDLWSALVMVDPLLDMLRFEHIGVGASWTGEFGSVTVPAERAFLEQTSPYNQLKPNMKYPEPLIIATTNDDRVGPQHARKFAAKMEEFHEPFYYHEIAEGGHGMGSDLAEEAWVWSLIYAYLGKKLMN